MFRPQIQKTRVLVLIALFNLLMVYFSVNSKVKVYQIGYEHKILAAEIMQNFINEFKKSINYNIADNDIYNSGLLGLKTSIITTKEELFGSNILSSKVACTHPNFASAIVEMFYELDIKEGNVIAVSMTGSFPGANIALLSACKAMNIKPIITSSAGSSAWGANRPEFSWPAIESFLYKKKLIDYKSVAYSIGGGYDVGDNLQHEGNLLISDVIFNLIDNKTEFVNESTLQDNIDKKLSIYKDYYKLSDYSVFVNIGGGSASLGYGIEKDTMKVGIISPLDIEYIEWENFKHTIAHTFLSSDIPMINIKNINKLGAQYNLYPPSLKNKIYKGALFIQYNNYNPIVILIGLISSLFIIVSIGFFSHLQIKRRMEEHEPDSVI